MSVRVLLVPNLANPASVEAARDLVGWMAKKGIEPFLVSEDAEGCGLPDSGVPAASIGQPELVVSLGGDGTILKSAHLLGYVEAPILGINFGRLGFMTGVDAGSIREAVTSALAGEAKVERRATLEAAVTMEGREVGKYRALNEVFVGKRALSRVVEISYAVNGVKIGSFSCDGVIVATATGSTAYALSAGGPIIAPSVSCGLVMPVAPHALGSRAMVIGPNDVVEISLPDPSRRQACVTVDGDTMPCRQAVESVSVHRCESDVLLLKLDGRDFYEVVATEFFGG